MRCSPFSPYRRSSRRTCADCKSFTEGNCVQIRLPLAVVARPSLARGSGNPKLAPCSNCLTVEALSAPANVPGKQGAPGNQAEENLVGPKHAEAAKGAKGRGCPTMASWHARLQGAGTADPIIPSSGGALASVSRCPVLWCQYLIGRCGVPLVLLTAFDSSDTAPQV